jgi:hypothetical protein
MAVIGNSKMLVTTCWTTHHKPESKCKTSGLLDSLIKSSVRCLKLALVHDLAECIVGDITPYCGVAPEEKHQREDAAMKELAQLAGPCGTELYGLYKVRICSRHMLVVGVLFVEVFS